MSSACTPELHLFETVHSSRVTQLWTKCPNVWVWRDALHSNHNSKADTHTDERHRKKEAVSQSQRTSQERCGGTGLSQAFGRLRWFDHVMKSYLKQTAWKLEKTAEVSLRTFKRSVAFPHPMRK